MFGMVPFNNRKANSIARSNDIFNFRSLMEDFFNDSFMPSVFTAGHPIASDIRETEKEYIVEAEMPGVNKEDIKLELRDDVLTISVEHNEQVNEERDNYIRKERRFGSFSRSFRVDGVDNKNVSAEYKDGILKVNLPKSGEIKEKTRRIDIQ